ncbi:hypothetical protein [Streptomyces sp. NPDC059009]|uniref:hypothetical protein n=1 Tax=Streptomyces sp. NPDC059009 TaxID=3346694 RepID=UPI0036925FC7
MKHMGRIAKSAGVGAAVAALTLSATSEALAAGGRWDDTWTTKGRTQVTKAHHVSKGKHFLHFGVKGNGNRSFKAVAYRVVGKKGGGNDVAVQKVEWKDYGSERVADWKRYTAGKYYIKFKYSVKNKKAYGGIG